MFASAARTLCRRGPSTFANAGRILARPARLSAHEHTAPSAITRREGRHSRWLSTDKKSGKPASEAPKKEVKPGNTGAETPSSHADAAPGQPSKESGGFTMGSKGGLVASVFAALIAVGTALRFIESKREEKRAERRKPKASGKAFIGGPWELVNEDGETMTHKDFIGEYQLIYFGFTYCPDICPAELDKMTEVLKRIDDAKLPRRVQPIFISVDPDRDGPNEVKEYLAEFDKRIVGLSGSHDQTKQISKTFRVYFSKGPPNPDDPMDYQVDHTVVMYLMDRNGDFLKHYASSVDARTMSEDIIRRIKDGEGM